MFTLIIRDRNGTERVEHFAEKEVLIGRVPGNSLVLRAGNISRQHARIAANGIRLIVSDLGSSNGTFVNGRRIRQPTILRDGDEIWIGDFYLRVELPSSSSTLGVQAPREPKWYVFSDRGGSEGPLSTSQVSSSIAAGEYTSTTQICREGDSKWQSLDAVDYFASALRSVSPVSADSADGENLAPHLLTEVPARLVNDEPAEVYWYVLDGQSEPQGPYTTNEIRQGVRHGDVPVTAKLNQAGTPDWFDLVAIPEFAYDVLRVGR